MTNSRRQAAFILARWILTKDFPASMLPTDQNRAFVQDLVYTAIRRIRPIRKILGVLMRQRPKGELEALLIVGVAQLLYMPEVPDFAAVNETVEAAKDCDSRTIAKVVNAVLRNVIRRRAEFEALIAAAPLEERESFPTVLVKRWQARFAAEEVERLCQWHNLPAETFLARKDGSFVKLERGQNVTAVAGFAAGEFIVQDPATKTAVELLAVKPGETVLDACAAPGGKTIQLAWRGAAVTACEVNPKRRRRLEENLTRLNLADAVKVLDSLDGAATFDKVLVDAPCSNTGVFRRRPDARWNWSEEKLAALVKLQGEILDRCAPLVALGGVLVYSTCSNEPEENQRQVAAFLARHPEFAAGEQRESLPFVTGTDGAFAAQLLRRAENACKEKE